MMSENPLLTVRDLCVAKSGSPLDESLVKGVSFHLNPGEVLGITGKSGSGKTLTALALAGILPPPLVVKKAKVKFMGDPVLSGIGGKKELTPGRDIMMLFQSPSRALDPWVKIGVHITDAVKAALVLKTGQRPHGCQKKMIKKTAVQALEKAGLDAAAFYRYPFELSGGQRQRCLVALALAVKPRILIADEPVTGQDDDNKALVVKGLQELADNEGTGIIIISHDLRGLKGLARNLVVIFNGRQIEAGPFQQIIDQPEHAHTRELVRAMKFLEGAGI